MPDTKISAMTSTVPAGPELVPVVQGGANFSVTCAQIAALAGGGGGPIWVTPVGMLLRWENVANVSFIQLTDGGILTGASDDNSIIDYRRGAGGRASLHWAANILALNCAFGAKAQMATSGAGFVGVDDAFNTFQVAGFAALQYQYIPAVPANWVGGVTEIQNALDRLAAAVIARTIGGAIP